MAEIKLDAEERNEFGKGAARRIRRADKIPAVLYGHGTAPQHVTLPGHATMLALRQANALLNLQLPGGKEQLALPKQVQRDPVKGFVEHVDLIIVRRGEKVTVEVPLVLTGEAAAETLVNQERNALAVHAEATNIPTELEVSIEGAEVGTQITAADITLPEGVTLADDPETLIVVVAAPISEEELEAELGETEGEDEAAEGEEGEDAEGAEGSDEDESDK